MKTCSLGSAGIETSRTSEHEPKPTLLHRAIRDELAFTGLASLLLGTSLFISPGAHAAVSCGSVAFNKATEQGSFLWQDCDTQEWHLRVTAGGKTIDYSGTITPDTSLTAITTNSYESDDVLDIDYEGETSYLMRVANTGQDGLDFSLPANASACIDTGGTAIVGPDRTQVTSPFDLVTLGACKKPTQTSCGAPTLNKATEKGTFLWQDCDTSQWHLRATAAGGSASYSGTIASAEAIPAITTYSFENGDTLDTTDPKKVGYLLNVSGTGQDGLDFSLASNASACLDAGGQVVVGAEKVAVDSPFDIQTLGTCKTDSDPPPEPTPTDYPYLKDAETSSDVIQMTDSDLDQRPFPRITTGPIKLSGTAEQFSKYGGIAVKAHRFDWLASVQQVNPDVMGFRIHCPQEYQGWTEQSCRTGSGIPFNGTGPSTADCNVYAGHWLYAPGSKLSGAISASTTSLKVADASRFNAGRYVVIYDGSPGAFQNAEHALVSAVNTSTNTLTLASRGYKSTASAHAAGAIVAEHVIGNGTGDGWEMNWVYNLSTASPRDASGRQINEVMADWLAENYDKDGLGNAAKSRIDGILYDSDFNFVGDGGHGRRPDVDNDLAQDDGISASGENLWGEGLDDFYVMVRERLPNLVTVGGVMESRGYTSLNGTQLEGFPNRNLGAYNEDYREIDGLMSNYSVQMHHGEVGPRYVESINRVSTKLYPYNGIAASGNAPFRFSFGLTLMDDGYYGQQNSNVTDPWWDEYAVDTAAGSSTYGRAIASDSQNESLIRSHAGWMGFPLGPRYRVYDKAAFALTLNLLADGTFDKGLGAWTGSNVTVSQDTASKNLLDGAGVMRISEQQRYSSSETGAAVAGPTVQLVAGREYTLTFAAKSSVTRMIQVGVGNQTEQFYIPATWARRVFTFTAPSSGNYNVRFNVGRESNPVWIDSVYLFEGNANLYRRDFDNATVVVNATPSTRTVDLGGTFQRILGTGQDPINDGSKVTKVTIAPYDAAILVRAR